MHKGERRGISALVFLLGLIFLIMFLIPYVFEPELADLEEREVAIAQILKAEEEFKKSKSRSKESMEDYAEVKDMRSNSKLHKTQKTLFAFDPNSCSDNEWKKLGLNSGQIKSINNYKNKGGKFYDAKDLEKMYTISSNQFLELAPFITIDKNQFAKKESKNWTKKEKPETLTFDIAEDLPLNININLADTIELDKLKGIGPYYARKIVEYRKELGGFISENQLLEIWNFKPETLDGIRNYINLGEDSVKKISINHCTADILAEHPYFNWKMANALVNYREAHGVYHSIEEITNSHLISEEACMKMKPYLKLN